MLCVLRKIDQKRGFGFRVIAEAIRNVVLK